jgi:hypothetical protein
VEALVPRAVVEAEAVCLGKVADHRVWFMYQALITVHLSSLERCASVLRSESLLASFMDEEDVFL